MAILGKSEQPARAGQGGGEVNRTAKRFLIFGILGVAILLAFAVSVAAKQGGSSTSSAAAPAAAAPVNVATGGQYRLSPPNELDQGGDLGGIPDSGERVPYRLSLPNEADASDGPGFTSVREDHRAPVAVPAAGFTDYREDHRSDGAPYLPGFTDYREDHRP